MQQKCSTIFFKGTCNQIIKSFLLKWKTHWTVLWEIRYGAKSRHVKLKLVKLILLFWTKFLTLTSGSYKTQVTREGHCMLLWKKWDRQFPLNLKHLISDCKLGFPYNYSFWFQVYTDWKDISEVIKSSAFEEDHQDLIGIFDIQACVR